MFVLWALGEDENLDEKLDNHEFRRDVLGDGEPVFGRLPFSVTVLSVDELLANPGLLFGIYLGEDGWCSA